MRLLSVHYFPWGCKSKQSWNLLRDVLTPSHSPPIITSFFVNYQGQCTQGQCKANALILPPICLVLSSTFRVHFFSRLHILSKKAVRKLKPPIKEITFFKYQGSKLAEFDKCGPNVWSSHPHFLTWCCKERGKMCMMSNPKKQTLIFFQTNLDSAWKHVHFSVRCLDSKREENWNFIINKIYKKKKVLELENN